MKQPAFINETTADARTIIQRFRFRDFSGNTGIAIKNSYYTINKTVLAKIGSLLFTILLARLLMPELYGLYGLALSTILLISSFSDFGISSALSTYLSKNIDARLGKAKGYFLFLSRIKFILILFGGLLIVLTADYFANNYYNKPIFYALIAGGIYYPVSYFSRYLGIVFVSKNNFKVDFIGEIIFQLLRLSVVPIAVLFLLSRVEDPNLLIFYILIALTFCFFVTGIYYGIAYKRARFFHDVKVEKLNKREKRELLYFTIPLSLTTLSGIFFGYIDTIMLGRYVDAAFIGYYQVAFHLTASISVIVSFLSASLFPLFSRFKGEQLKRAFRKGRSITAIISMVIAMIIVIIAPYFIHFLYGRDYNSSVILLQSFSALIVILSLTSLYESYYTSQKMTKFFSGLLFISTIGNIILNYSFIHYGLQLGMMEATLGACFATIITRGGYLLGLMMYKRSLER